MRHTPSVATAAAPDKKQAESTGASAGGTQNIAVSGSIKNSTVVAGTYIPAVSRLVLAVLLLALLGAATLGLYISHSNALGRPPQAA
jgi:hypothetical protein